MTRSARLLAVLLLVAGPLAGPASAAPPDQADAIEIMTRDVFVVLGASLRNPDTTTAPHEPLYNVAGLRLPLTWGEWSAGTATSRVAAVGHRTDVRLSFQHLVPEGLYSVFWATIGPDSEHPSCPGVERSLPLDAFRSDPLASDPSSFVADATGGATFHGRVDGNLPAATQLFFSVVYHADGQTYYPLPNRGEFLTQGGECRSSYGHDAMRQFLILQKW
jgi:hypothetical protein